MNHSLSLKEWAEEDRPREKLTRKGKSSLTDAELLAILLGSGTRKLTAVDLAKLILKEVDHDLHRLGTLSINDLKKHKGVGEAKAITIVSALELGRRRKASEPSQKPKITSSGSAHQLIEGDLTDLQHEEFWVILLKRNNEVIKKVRISSGGVSGTVADPKLVFNAAIESLASAIILAHNHPSGNLTPSDQDKHLTNKLIQAGQTLDIKVLDHIIVGQSSYFSFADEGMMQ
ncbi:MAG: DNA repair protein RadC [Cyclobacteriaceae bacterium]